MALPMIEQRLGIDDGLGWYHETSLEAIPDNSCRQFMST
jgi:hypothetical protein